MLTLLQEKMEKKAEEMQNKINDWKFSRQILRDTSIDQPRTKFSKTTFNPRHHEKTGSVHKFIFKEARKWTKINLLQIDSALKQKEYKSRHIFILPKQMKV
jgi:hypothetical protein